VAELVEQDRCEEQQSRDDCRSEIRAVGQARVLGRKDAVRQRPDDQGEDGEQAPVEPNLDAAEASDREVPVHRPFFAFRFRADART
jgi:hypothetical protein